MTLEREGKPISLMIHEDKATPQESKHCSKLAADFELNKALGPVSARYRRTCGGLQKGKRESLFCEECR
jgi:hypothetical protein